MLGERWRVEGEKGMRYQTTKEDMIFYLPYLNLLLLFSAKSYEIIIVMIPIYNEIIELREAREFVQDHKASIQISQEAGQVVWYSHFFQKSNSLL